MVRADVGNPRIVWLAFGSGVLLTVVAFALLSSLLEALYSPRVTVTATSRKPNTYHAPKVNVFADLTVEERTAVSSFFHQNHQFLAQSPTGSEFTTRRWVDQVEAIRPNKSDVLAYMDDDDALPHRYAKVSVVQYDKDTAYMLDYIVGPLPPSSRTSIQPLAYPYTSGRNWIKTVLPDVMTVYLWSMGVGVGVEDITDDLLGAKVNFLNPLSPNSLGMGARPILIEEDRMVLWLEFFRAGAGSNAPSLLPQGLYVKLNMNTYDPDNWTTSEWFYNGIVYSNITTFREAWESPDFVKVSRNLDGPWTQTEDFDSQPSGRSQPPPLSIQPYGPRYEIDKIQKHISWMGFSFYLATSQSTAMSLFDIRFNKSRIIYHLGLQEALAHYAGSEPIQSGLEFLDTVFGMGSNMFSLVPGFDCPAYADYFDMTYHKGDQTFTNRNAICVFEYTSDAPLQRHTSEWSVTVSRNTYLVVRSISTVGNYDYTIDYLFYLDGSIEVKVRASGFIFAAFAGHPATQTASSSNTDSDDLRSRSSPPTHTNHRYGYQIHPSASTSMHDHTLLFRADLDISPTGHNDTFSRVSVTPYTHTYPWDANTPDLPTPRNTMQLTHHPVLAHESGLNWPSNSGDMYLVQSPTLNAWGENKAYRILPGTGMGAPSHLTIHNSTSLGRSAHWASSDLWILKNHAATQPSGAHYLNALSPQTPQIDFSRLADNESLNDADDGDDLVVYFNLGAHHVPNAADIPNTLMHTSASSIMFSPFNYFDEDVSKYSRQGVRVDAQTKESVDWVEGVRVVGGGRYTDLDAARLQNKKKHAGELMLDVERDLEPSVAGYFEEEDRKTVGKRVGGGLWGLWPKRGW